MKQIKPLELKALLDSGASCKVIDIREDYELDICRMEGASHIPMAMIAEKIGEIPGDGLVVILCKSGNRAAAVANWLSTDFKKNNVMYLEGGILQWIAQVQPQLETY